MKWIDLERGAKEYEATFPGGMTEPDSKFSYSTQKGHLRVFPPLRMDPDISSLNQDLERLQVEEVFAMLLREKWSKGNIIPLINTSSSPMTGFHLVSHPYPILRVINKGKSAVIGLEEEDTSLTVRIFNSEYEGLNSFEVADDHTYKLNTAAEQLLISDAIQRYGLAEGLRHTISAAGKRRISTKTMLSTKDPNAFLWAVQKHISTRESFQSMPEDIRSWNQSILDQLGEELSTTLQKEHIVHSGELRRWAHDQKDNPGWMRLIDKFSPWGFGL